MSIDNLLADGQTVLETEAQARATLEQHKDRYTPDYYQQALTETAVKHAPAAERVISALWGSPVEVSPGEYELQGGSIWQTVESADFALQTAQQAARNPPADATDGHRFRAESIIARAANGNSLLAELKMQDAATAYYAREMSYKIQEKINSATAEADRRAWNIALQTLEDERLQSYDQHPGVIKAREQHKAAHAKLAAALNLSQTLSQRFGSVSAWIGESSGIGVSGYRQGVNVGQRQPNGDYWVHPISRTRWMGKVEANDQRRARLNSPSPLFAGSE